MTTLCPICQQDSQIIAISCCNHYACADCYQKYTKVCDCERTEVIIVPSPEIVDYFFTKFSNAHEFVTVNGICVHQSVQQEFKSLLQEIDQHIEPIDEPEPLKQIPLRMNDQLLEKEISQITQSEEKSDVQKSESVSQQQQQVIQNKEIYQCRKCSELGCYQTFDDVCKLRQHYNNHQPSNLKCDTQMPGQIKYFMSEFFPYVNTTANGEVIISILLNQKVLIEAMIIGGQSGVLTVDGLQYKCEKKKYQFIPMDKLTNKSITMQFSSATLGQYFIADFVISSQPQLIVAPLTQYQKCDVLCQTCLQNNSQNQFGSLQKLAIHLQNHEKSGVLINKNAKKQLMQIKSTQFQLGSEIAVAERKNNTISFDFSKQLQQFTVNGAICGGATTKLFVVENNKNIVQVIDCSDKVQNFQFDFLVKKSKLSVICGEQLIDSKLLLFEFVIAPNAAKPPIVVDSSAAKTPTSKQKESLPKFDQMIKPAVQNQPNNYQSEQISSAYQQVSAVPKIVPTSEKQKMKSQIKLMLSDNKFEIYVKHPKLIYKPIFVDSDRGTNISLNQIQSCIGLMVENCDLETFSEAEAQYLGALGFQATVIPKVNGARCKYCNPDEQCAKEWVE